MSKENKSKRKREKCSDCYYNGNCLIPLSKCKYLIKKKKDILKKISYFFNWWLEPESNQRHTDFQPDVTIICYVGAKNLLYLAIFSQVKRLLDAIFAIILYFQK